MTMTIEQIRQMLNAQVFCGAEHLGRTVKNACGADLMSDVLMFVKNDCVLLTGLCNTQVIRTSEMLDVSAIGVVRRKRPAQVVLGRASGQDMVLLGTDDTLYTACGKLYATGLPGTTRKEGA